MMLGEARKRRAHYLPLLVKEGSSQPAMVAFQLILAKLVHQSELFTVGREWGGEGRCAGLGENPQRKNEAALSRYDIRYPAFKDIRSSEVAVVVPGSHTEDA